MGGKTVFLQRRYYQVAGDEHTSMPECKVSKERKNKGGGRGIF